MPFDFCTRKYSSIQAPSYASVLHSQTPPNSFPFCLAFEENAVIWSFEPDQETIFYFPLESPILPIQQAYFLEHGAIAGTFPAASDCILLNTRNYRQYGIIPTDQLSVIFPSGQWYCTWLGLFGNKKIWLDRFYQPSVRIDQHFNALNFEEAHFEKTHSVFFDQPSRLCFYPGVQYKYIHRGAKTFQKLFSLFVDREQKALSSIPYQSRNSTWSFATVFETSLVANTLSRTIESQKICGNYNTLYPSWGLYAHYAYPWSKLSLFEQTYAHITQIDFQKSQIKSHCFQQKKEILPNNACFIEDYEGFYYIFEPFERCILKIDPSSFQIVNRTSSLFSQRLSSYYDFIKSLYIWPSHPDQQQILIQGQQSLIALRPQTLELQKLETLPQNYYYFLRTQKTSSSDENNFQLALSPFFQTREDFWDNVWTLNDQRNVLLQNDIPRFETFKDEQILDFEFSPNNETLWILTSLQRVLIFRLYPFLLKRPQLLTPQKIWSLNSMPVYQTTTSNDIDAEITFLYHWSIRQWVACINFSLHNEIYVMDLQGNLINKINKFECIDINSAETFEQNLELCRWRLSLQPYQIWKQITKKNPSLSPQDLQLQIRWCFIYPQNMFFQHWNYSLPWQSERFEKNVFVVQKDGSNRWRAIHNFNQYNGSFLPSQTLNIANTTLGDSLIEPSKTYKFFSWIDDSFIMIFHQLHLGPTITTALGYGQKEFLPFIEKISKFHRHQFPGFTSLYYSLSSSKELQQFLERENLPYFFKAKPE